MRSHRRLLTVFMSLIVLALLASVSLAGPGVFSGPHDAVTTEDTEGEACEETTDGDGEDCVADEEPTEEDGATDDGSEPADVDAERQAACMAAARIEPPQEGETEGGTDEVEEVKAHGLDNAIEHVLANCVKNPQSPGLLNALEHLAANRERHEAHEIWRAERKAERDAAKAERDAAKAERKSGKSGVGSQGNGHGSGGEHGNPHGSGHSK